MRIKTEFPIAGLKMLIHDPGNASGTGGGRQSSLGGEFVYAIAGEQNQEYLEKTGKPFSHWHALYFPMAIENVREYKKAFFPLLRKTREM